MVSIEGLHAGYGPREVIAALDLALPAGEVHGVVGPNGAGKTTLLETIYGFVRARAGRIALNGERPGPRNTAYLPTENHFYPRMTGREYLRIFRARAPEFDTDAWAELFAVPLDRLVDEYSAGMKKKLALIATLSLNRPAILLDEPSNNLDVESNLLLVQVLRRLAEAGRVVLVTSHILEALTGACDRIHLLEGGRIARSFGPAEFGAIEHALMGEHREARYARVRELVARGQRAP